MHGGRFAIHKVHLVDICSRAEMFFVLMCNVHTTADIFVKH